MASATEKCWTITPASLSELINRKRKELNKTPIDHGTITTRLVLKSNVYHPGVFDFEAPVLKLDREKLALLENLLHDQFGLHLENQLVRHCKPDPATMKRAKPQPIPRPVQTPPQPQKGGVMSKLKQLLKQ
jgi:hypothetical protein